MRDITIKVAQKAGIPSNRVMHFWDVLRTPETKSELFYSDGFHPNKKGHDELGEVAFQIVKNTQEF